MYNHFMFQSQYWQQTLWTWIYVKQGHPPFTAALWKIFYICSHCQSLTPLEAKLSYKYSRFGEFTLEGKLHTYWVGCRVQKSRFFNNWRCLDYIRSWWSWQQWFWLSWPWWGRPQWWDQSLFAVPPAPRRNWTIVLPFQQTASRCWGSLVVAAAWPALWRKGRPVGFTQPTVVRVSAALPGPVRPGLYMLWPEDRGSALKTWAKVVSVFHGFLCHIIFTVDIRYF